MKNLISLSVLIFCTFHIAFAQSYFRTGFYQGWKMGAYQDSLKFDLEYEGAPGQGLVVVYNTALKTNNSWIPLHRSINSGYNTDTIRVLKQNWDTTTQQYINNERNYTALHPISGKPVGSLEEMWNGTNWIRVQRNEVVYNAENLKVEEIRSIWNGSWQVVTRSKYFYNQNNLPHVVHEDSLNSAIWQTYSMDSSKFDGNGNQTEKATWTKMFGVFMPISRQELVYNGSNQLISGTTYLIYPGNIQMPFWTETRAQAGDGLVNSTFQYNTVMPPANPVWTNSSRIIWNPFSANREILGVADVVLFPNPCTIGILNIRFQNPGIRSCSIRDAAGKTIYRTKVDYREVLTIPTTELPTGIWMLYFKNEENKDLSTFKFINIR